MLGFPILYCKGMRPMMFQLSGFCYNGLGLRVFGFRGFGVRVKGFRLSAVVLGLRFLSVGWAIT